MDHFSTTFSKRRGLITIFIACVVIALVYVQLSSNPRLITETSGKEITKTNPSELNKVVKSPETIVTSPESVRESVSTSPGTVSTSSESTTEIVSASSETPTILAKLAGTTLKSTGSSRTAATDKYSATVVTEPVATINTESETEPVHARGWDSGSFCDDLLHNTFSHLVPVCTTDHNEQSAIICKRTLKSTRMIECSMRNVLIRPKKLFNGIISNKVVNSEGVELLENDLVSCKSPNIQEVYRTTESNDHTRRMVEESLRRPPSLKRSDCQRWISEPTFLFLGVNVHVYFEFITWYNVYKSILDQGNIGPYKVIRVASGNIQYLFGDYEKLLFPGIEFVQNMTEESVCFEKLILPPRGFSSLMFRCKMEYDIRSQCFKCNGKGRPGTAIRSFRTQALKACSLDDSIPIAGYRNPKRIVVIVRKQYERYPGDKPESFLRVLSNNDELIAEIKSRFKVDVVSFHGEDLSVCEQIRIVHDADIFIGLHGAGLVHAWWLQDNALLFEIEPSDQSGNPTFRMLTTLAGLNYKSFRISQPSSRPISVDVKKFADALDATIQHGI